MEYLYDNVTKWDWVSYWSETEYNFDSSQDWTDAGASVVGGCCEIGPAHIARLRELLH